MMPFNPHVSRKKIHRHPLVEQLIARRVKLKMTQRMLAERVVGLGQAGLPTNTIWRWETKMGSPNMHNFFAWCNALGYKVTLVDDDTLGSK